MTAPDDHTRLIVTVEAGDSAAERLGAALAAAPIASVIIAPGPGQTLDAASALPLVTLVQKAGAAALISGDARLARTLKADGVHLPVSDTAEASYAEARDILGQRFVVGFDAGSKHDAMTLGEAGAEYVGFGIPAFVKEREDARGRRLELIDWSAEIFEVPCVACDVETAEDARALALAGADFVAFALPSGETAAATRARVLEMAAAIDLSDLNAGVSG